MDISFPTSSIFFLFYNTAVSVLLCALNAIPEHNKKMKLDINYPSFFLLTSDVDWKFD